MDFTKTTLKVELLQLQQGLHDLDAESELNIVEAQRIKIDSEVDSYFVIIADVPLLGRLSIYQLSDSFFQVASGDGNYYNTRAYRIGIGSHFPANRIYSQLGVLNELGLRCEIVLKAKRKSLIIDTARLIKLVAEKKEARTCLQTEQEDVHSYCGNTQIGNFAISNIRDQIMTATVTAIVTKAGDKFACTVNGASLGTSKHKDYFEYHLRKGDVKALREAGITHFVYDIDGVITTVEAKAKEAKPAAVAAEPTASAAVEPAAVLAIQAALDVIPASADAEPAVA